MAVDTGLEPAVRSSRIICFQDRLLTIRIIHHIFNLRIHFFRLGGDGNCYTVIPPNQPWFPPGGLNTDSPDYKSGALTN